jgi:hypothetical protein
MPALSVAAQEQHFEPLFLLLTLLLVPDILLKPLPLTVFLIFAIVGAVDEAEVFLSLLQVSLDACITPITSD